MNREASVYWKETLAGKLREVERGYAFAYDVSYLHNKGVRSISLTLPLSEKEYVSTVLFPFFDGLIPEGWLLDIVHQNWKLNYRDRMGLLLACCKDCIGAVSVVPENE